MSSSDADLEAQSHVSLPEAAKYRRGQRKSIMQTTMAESLKLRQMKAKAQREQQRNRIDGRHKHLFTVVADMVKLDPNTVEEYMLDGNQVSQAYAIILLAVFTTTVRCSWTCLKSCLQQMDGKRFCFTTKRQKPLYQVSTTIA